MTTTRNGASEAPQFLRAPKADDESICLENIPYLQGVGGSDSDDPAAIEFHSGLMTELSQHLATQPENSDKDYDRLQFLKRKQWDLFIKNWPMEQTAQIANIAENWHEKIYPILIEHLLGVISNNDISKLSTPLLQSLFKVMVMDTITTKRQFERAEKVPLTEEEQRLPGLAETTGVLVQLFHNQLNGKKGVPRWQVKIDSWTCPPDQIEWKTKEHNNQFFQMKPIKDSKSNRRSFSTFINNRAKAQKPCDYAKRDLSELKDTRVDTRNIMDGLDRDHVLLSLPQAGCLKWCPPGGGTDHFDDQRCSLHWSENGICMRLRIGEETIDIPMEPVKRGKAKEPRYRGRIKIGSDGSIIPVPYGSRSKQRNVQVSIKEPMGQKMECTGPL